MECEVPADGAAYRCSVSGPDSVLVNQGPDAVAAKAMTALKNGPFGAQCPGADGTWLWVLVDALEGG